MKRALNRSGLTAAFCLSFPIVVVAGSMSDDFQGYQLGTFPAANWHDTAVIAPFGPAAPPSPSCVVGTTTDAFGQPSQALHLDGSWVGSASGIYRAVPQAPAYSLRMDVRTDSFGDGATDNPSDWPWMIGVSRFDANQQAGGWHSLQMYGSNLSHDFRGYAIHEQDANDFPLGETIGLGDWYTIQIDADATTGVVRHRVWDTGANTLLVDSTAAPSAWSPVDCLFDVVTINQGELSSTSSSDVWVDNIDIVVLPEPTTLPLMALAALRAVRRRR